MCITWLQNSTDYKADGGDDLCFRFLIKQKNKNKQLLWQIVEMQYLKKKGNSAQSVVNIAMEYIEPAVVSFTLCFTGEDVQAL